MHKCIAKLYVSTYYEDNNSLIFNDLIVELIKKKCL